MLGFDSEVWVVPLGGVPARGAAGHGNYLSRKRISEMATNTRGEPIEKLSYPYWATAYTARHWTKAAGRYPLP
jgi:hypothetical protein